MNDKGVIKTMEPKPGQFGAAFLAHDKRVFDNTTKVGAHPHERMAERTSLHPSHVDILQRAVDTLSLPKASYHLPLRGQSGAVIGYAQFKGVPNRRAPVLATILGPEMTPGGANIEDMLKLSFTEEDKTPRLNESTERPGFQRPRWSTINRAFGNMTQSTGQTMESAT